MEVFALVGTLSGVVWGITSLIKRAVNSSGFVTNGIAFAVSFLVLWLYGIPLASAVFTDFGAGIGFEPRDLAEFVEYAVGSLFVVGGSALTHEVFGRK